jgi:tetratricopeptide (TPR) repeat protein
MVQETTGCRPIKKGQQNARDIRYKGRKYNIMKTTCFFGVMLWMAALAAQPGSELLARQYMQNREYEKAADLYEELSTKNPTEINLYDAYLTALLMSKQGEKAEKLVNRRKKKYPQVLQYRVDEAYLLENKGQVPEAEKLYKRVADHPDLTIQQYYEAADAFRRRSKYNWAIYVYEQGEEKFGFASDFSTRLAQMYMETGNKAKGLEKYVQMVLTAGYAYEQSKQLFEMNVLDSADFATLRTILLRKLQKSPDNYELNDLLKWTFIKTKDWESAFIQTRALDKRLKEKGVRLIELGDLCVSNEAWSVATRCYEYVKTLGATGEYYNAAVSGLLETRFQQLKTEAKPAPETWLALEAEMLQFLAENGYNDGTWSITSRLSDVYTQYKHTPQKAIELLEKFYQSPGISLKNRSQAKLALGDAYVAHGDVWSSELLFAQVEKDFPEDPLGQEAKYRRARLSYYRGDYDWAMLQLDVLKGATTQLISNNAIRLALTITENLGIDSNYDALERFSRAELLLAQNKLEEAEREMDSIPKLYPGHSLSDDILLQKAVIREKQFRFAEAAELYNTLVVAFGHDILADNGWYRLGLLYEYKLKDLENARKAYEKIILEFPGSYFIPEARAHFRKLRGDKLGS